MNRFRPTLTGILLGTCLVLILCAGILLSAGFIGAGGSSSVINLFNPPTSTPLVIRPTVKPSQELPEAVQSLEPSPSDSQATLKALQETTPPQLDYFELAAQLEGKPDLAHTVPPPVAPWKIGDRQEFWATNTDTNRHFQVEATLQAETEHAYFWIQTGVTVPQADLDRAAETFEADIYPVVREFFGSEWTPGVDGDPHLYILYVSGLGKRLLGYYSPVDEYPPAINRYSNAHELFFLNADKLDFANTGIEGTLAHEFQHMIQWHVDRNEETWFNEGSSELAAALAGFGQERSDDAYLNNPDIQLTDWPEASSSTPPHYRAGFLFLAYFLDHFGEAATRALVDRPENGLASVDAELAALGARDPQTGSILRADDLFIDWLVANYLQNGRVADGWYGYKRFQPTSQPSVSETIASCPADNLTRDVHQYGVNYWLITCPENYTIHFVGSTQTGVVPVDPHSGTTAFWSNRAEESDPTLTRSFDFSRTSGPLNLTYWGWYDLEKDYDYLYLESSTDGQHWEILKTPACTSKNPSGNNYGCGYNGASGGWIQQKVDLSRFAGQVVQLRFQYITDGAVNGDGFLLDDVQIPEIGYKTDFENDEGGWKGDGWVRIQNNLPQTYRLALIYLGDNPRVEKISLQSDNTASIPVQQGTGTEAVVLVVTGTSRFSRLDTAYRVSVSKP